MHHDPRYVIAMMRIREDHAHAEAGRLHARHRRARPPGVARQTAARYLVRLAVRLADEPARGPLRRA